MLREQMVNKKIGEEEDFRWRGTEVGRIEGFTDGVFALGLTLLIVSLEVPKNYGELVRAMYDFPAFAICFALLSLVWYEQYKFFRRYGLHDAFCIVVNLALLFVLLFFLYPLKFIFTHFLRQFFPGAEPSAFRDMNPSQNAFLLIVYGAAFVSVFVIFVVLHRHALRLRERLELNQLEAFEVRHSIRESIMMVGIGALSIVFAMLGLTSIGSLIYWLIPVVFTIHGMASGKRKRLLKQRMAQVETAKVSEPETFAPGRAPS